MPGPSGGMARRSPEALRDTKAQDVCGGAKAECKGTGALREPQWPRIACFCTHFN